MELFSKDEIINKHGKPVYYFSKSIGNTDLEKFKNSYLFNDKIIEYTIQGKNDIYACFVEYNRSEHRENCGWFMKVFNTAGELIEDTFPKAKLHNKSQKSAEEVLVSLGFQL